MRRQPVAFALIDAAFLADSKWRALGRRLPDPTSFNSALGAWLRILTAARRNGLPEVDATEESEDPTYLTDLIAVGLLTETGIPAKPYRAWAPARPKYPSDFERNEQTVTDSTSAPNAPSSPFSPYARASTPIPSLPLNSLPEKNEEPRARGTTTDEREWTDEQVKAAYIAAQSKRTGVA